MERAPVLLSQQAAIADAMGPGFVVVMEPNFTGHRWRYVEWITQTCLEAGHPCLVVTESVNEDHRLSREIVAANRDDLQIAYVDAEERTRAPNLDRISYVRFHRYFQHAFETVSRVEPIRLVVVPYADYFLHVLPFLGSPFGKTPWVAITMRTTFHHPKMGIRSPDTRPANAVKEQIFRRVVRTSGLRTLLSIDPTLPEWFARAKPRHGADVVYLPDPFPDTPAEDPALARQRLGLDPHARYLLVYGAIAARKGICELVEAVAGLKDAPTLLIAGEQEAETRGFMRAYVPHMSPRPVIIDSFIGNDAERDLFSACDAVWLGYKGHYGSSGVLIQAYRFGKPVIATADGLIGWFCRDGRLGPRVEDLSPATIKRALDEVAAQWWNGRPADAGAPESLLSRNTLAQFKETLRQTIVQVR